MGNATTQLASGTTLGGPLYRSNIPLGGIPAGLLGKDIEAVGYTLYLTEIWVERNISVSGFGWLNGSETVGHSMRVVLFSSGGKVLVYNNAALDHINTDFGGIFQFVSPSSASLADEPGSVSTDKDISIGRYWFGFMATSGAPLAVLRVIPAGTYTLLRTGTVANYVASITDLPPRLRPSQIPTVFTPDCGPICYITGT